MAILRSLEGRFYEIPDHVLSGYLIPADKVKERMKDDGGDLDSLDDADLKAVSGGNTSGPVAEWHNKWTPV
jgi:hypothetical protein